jgi:hypothetical protein
MLAIITDALAPSSKDLQAVSTWWVWWNGYFHNNWCAAGLSMSDHAELLAIAAAFNNIPHPLDRICAIHIFSDSTNAIQNSLDGSHHSEQLSSLCICNVILPWLTLHDANHVFSSQMVWTWRTTPLSTFCALVPVYRLEILLQSVLTMLDKQLWIIYSPSGILCHRKSYIGSNFPCLYDEAKNPLVPIHLNSGPWI